ncbi:MAG: tyrosine-type recombinase/integrase [Candidatus Cryptobacteroides sp.]|jgi:integrase/recombinase XerD
MATTFSLEVKKTPSSKGRFPVFIRITKDRKHKRIRTSVSISRLTDWNPKGAKNRNWVRSSEKNAEAWNNALEKELEEVTELYREDKDASIDSIAYKFKNKDISGSFLLYAKARTQELAEMGKTNAKHYKTFCNKFEDYLNSVGKKDITFSELSPAIVSGFNSYLQKIHNQKHKNKRRRLHTNYIRTLLAKLRALVNRAISEELIADDKYPFKKYPIPKEIETEKEALDESEIQAIVALDYPSGSWLSNTRNAFLFSFYCAGIRVGDLLQLRWSDIVDEGGRLEYSMGKNKKQRNYPLMPQAKAILQQYRKADNKPSDYIFPFLDSSADYAKEEDVETMPVDLKKRLFGQIYSKNTLLNRYLKVVAKDAGITKNVSFHISRHSFASLAREKAVPSKVVQEVLAHSSLSTTERYLHSFGRDEVDSALQKVFSPKESKDEALLDALRELDKDKLTELLNKLKNE